MTEFKVGDIVEVHAGKMFWKWEGKRGVVTQVDDTHYDPEHRTLIHVSHFDVGGVVGGWYPESLVLIDTNAEARALLGDEYFA